MSKVGPVTVDRFIADHFVLLERLPGEIRVEAQANETLYRSTRSGMILSALSGCQVVVVFERQPHRCLPFDMEEVDRSDLLDEYERELKQLEAQLSTKRRDLRLLKTFFSDLRWEQTRRR